MSKKISMMSMSRMTMSRIAIMRIKRNMVMDCVTTLSTASVSIV